ncbi:MAG: hypothetical protein QM346_18905 [Chloroflexota bacterium]|nr:hypothetical protein [Chloroflexota bacterium]
MTLEQSTHDLIDNRTGRDERRQRSVDLVSTVWRWLLSPWTLFSAGTATLILLPAAFFLPQLPGQLNDEPAAAARWLLAAGAAYGALGNTLRVAGLFNLLGSLLFRTLLAFITLLVALHFADCLGKAFAVRTLMARFGTLTAQPGSPVTPPDGLAVYRTRKAVDDAPSALAARIAASMAQRYGYLARHETGELAGSQETRFLGVRRRHAYALQVLPPLGLLLALAAVWLFLLAGWNISSPILAPGQAYRAPAQDLLIQYLVDPGAESSVAVSVLVEGEEVAAAAPPGARLRTGSISLQIQQEGAGLLVRTITQEPLLALPGQTDPTVDAGLILPSPGSEESILLPSLEGGLRVVRPPDGSDSFLVEVYRGLNLEPEQRIEITGPAQHEIGAAEQKLQLEFIPMPGLRVNVRHMPGFGLIWPAAILLIIGAAGYVLPPAFTLVQIAPWPAARAVVIVQTTLLTDLDRLSLEPGNAAGPAPIEPP